MTYAEMINSSVENTSDILWRFIVFYWILLCHENSVSSIIAKKRVSLLDMFQYVMSISYIIKGIYQWK